MSERIDSQDKFDRLRRQAETLVARNDQIAAEIPGDIIDLIHELKVHQAELEIQNEELKRAQEELSQLHREYQDLYEFAPCGYLTLDARGIITRANLTAVSLLGTTRGYLLHSGLSAWIALGWEDAYFAVRAAVEQSGEKQMIELPVKTAEAAPRWIRLVIEADRDPSGAVLQWRMVFHDVTARRAAETEKERLEDQLRQAQKMESIGTLAGGIAHEFNNVLTIIIGNNELVLDELPAWSPLRENAEEIRVAGLRARDVVRQLLTFSRQDDAKKAPVDLGAVVEDSVRLIRSSTPATIEMQTTIAADLPAVLANATQINQVLINLCANAADAMPPSGGAITIDVDDARIEAGRQGGSPGLKPGRYARLTVGDNGCGMDPATLERVFEPYFTTKEFGRGTGIGLAVVHGIVERHGGAIGAASVPGEGTTFTIWLPACPDSVERAEAVCDALPGGSERILLVDDEPSILKLTRRRLESLGYAVVAAGDPQEALQLFEAAPGAFDMLVTDMAMPKMSGVQLAAGILKIRPDIPVMLCTGYSDKISQGTARDAGIASFAMKPLDRADFAVRIREAFDQAKAAKPK